MQERFDWQSVFRDGRLSGSHSGKQDDKLREVTDEVEMKKCRESLRFLLVLNGLSLAALALPHGSGWVYRSPILNVLGGAAVLLLLLVCWLCGIAWWCVTCSHAVRLWAQASFPFGVQPYRSALGVIAVFVLLAVLSVRISPRSRWAQQVCKGLCVLLQLTMVLFGTLAVWAWASLLSDIMEGTHAGV